MDKTKKLIIAVLSVLLVLSIAAAAITSAKSSGKLSSGNYKTDDSILNDFMTQKTNRFITDYPLVQTQQKGLFYQASPDGKIEYYKYTDGAFIGVEEGVKKKTVKFECSYQKLSIDVYYLKTEVGTVGYGLFCTSQESNVKLLSYVFVRLMDCPAAFKNAAKTNYVLLVSRNPKEAYKADKSYSEMYSYNLETNTAVLIVSQRDRTVQEDGTVNEGWTIFTDSSVNSAKKHDLFASTRINDAKAEKPLYCVMTVANSRAGKKNEAATVTNCVSYEIREKDGNYFCFASTDKGFDLVKNGDKKKPLKSFEGSFSDYAVSGDWIFDKVNAELTCITTGESVSLQKNHYENLAGFAANETGDKFVFFIDEEVQALIMFDKIENSEQIIANEGWFDRGIPNFCFINADSYMFSNYDSSSESENTMADTVVNF